MSEKKRLIALSSPSGGGKTTVARFLLKKYPGLKFSVSATTRHKRPNEVNGKDYYFLTNREFEEIIENGGFIEYEEIFGNFYGTLHSEINEALGKNEFMIFDVDVKGAMSLKKAYPDDVITIFLVPPDMAELEKRLRSRSTETEEQILGRLSRARMEMEKRDRFDYIIINNILEDTLREADELLKNHID